ncbi:MAG: DUF433 domain-containing protein [Sphingobacteriia bacterium]|nr:DUF433 domain-containing protein [Sphingobacteriia bacterium]NCC40226.1 DUF433 domain-containing protein [Gammaproteobacteria bacterium]
MVLDRARLLDRITSRPTQCGGHPCIRGMRIRVADILDLLAEGISSGEILADFPDLEPEDIQACLLFAIRDVSGHPANLAGQ